MTTKYITTYVAAGYTLSAAYDTLDITSTGGVGGRGVYSGHVATLINDGSVVSKSGGVYLRFGGTVLNGSATDTAATIQGPVRSQFTALTVVNYGVITGYVRATSVTNEGTIQGNISGRYVSVITNGSAADTTAVVTGGVSWGSGVVSNFGTIDGDSLVGTLSNHGTFLGGVTVFDTVVNGGIDDASALIEGAIRTEGPGTSVVNYGVVEASGANYYGVLLESSYLVNGAPTDTTALIEGKGYGVETRGGVILNYGSIVGGSKDGVLAYSGLIANGVGAHSGALIKGEDGVLGNGPNRYQFVSLTNAGTIEGSAHKGVGVELEAANSQIFNGSTRNHTALIEGYSGVILTTAQRIVNEATIKGEGATGGFGVQMAGGYLANGAAGYRRDLISGHTGVDVTAAGGTVVNFGTIAGGAGGAVVFHSASDVLVVENGCRFIGAVEGGGGTLDLDSGRGTLAGLTGDAGIVVRGIMRPATFSSFGTLRIGVYADFKLAGAGSVAAGQTVVDAGELALGGPMGAGLTNAGLIETTGAGVLTLGGRVANSGTIAADGGTIMVAGRLTGRGLVAIDAATLELRRASGADVTFTGRTGVLVLDQSQQYTAAIAHFSYVGGTSLDLRDIAFVGRKQATYAGDARGGVLTVTDGTHTARIAFTGDYRAAQFIASSDGRGGVLIGDGAGAASAPPAAAVGRLASAAAGLGAQAGGPLHFAGLDRPGRETLFAAPRTAPA